MKKLIPLLVLLCGWNFSNAQIGNQINISAIEADSVLMYELTLKDGNKFLGSVQSNTGKIIYLKTNSLGVLQIPIMDIKSMVLVKPSNIIEGEFWADNPQSTRYFWQPNGYGLKQGEGYYQNVWILMNQFSVGVTDHFTLGGGFMPIFLFGGTASPFWLTPKFSIPIVENKVNIAAGALLGYVLGGETGFGIPYGALTLGSKDKNVSFGIGYGYADGGWASSPTITFSSMIRTGKKGYFMTENYLIGSSGSTTLLLSMGGRRIVGNRVGIDFGGVMPVNGSMERLVIIPWLGITVPFK